MKTFQAFFLTVACACAQESSRFLQNRPRISNVKKRDIVVNNQVLLNRAEDHPGHAHHHGGPPLSPAAPPLSPYGHGYGQQPGFPHSPLPTVGPEALNEDIFRDYANLGHLLQHPGGVRGQTQLFRQAVAGRTLTAVGPGVVDGGISAPGPVITRQNVGAGTLSTDHAGLHPLHQGPHGGPFDSFKQGVAGPALTAVGPEAVGGSISAPGPVITEQTSSTGLHSAAPLHSLHHGLVGHTSHSSHTHHGPIIGGETTSIELQSPQVDGFVGQIFGQPNGSPFFHPGFGVGHVSEPHHIPAPPPPVDGPLFYHTPLNAPYLVPTPVTEHVQHEAVVHGAVPHGVASVHEQEEVILPPVHEAVPVAAGAGGGHPEGGLLDFFGKRQVSPDDGGQEEEAIEPVVEEDVVEL